MFAVGHITLGYVTGKLLSRTTETSLNVPAIWALSLLPDTDLIIPGLEHRGPTHSLIVALVFSIPFFIVWSRKAVPYFVALATHSMIGDYITDGGIKLFWPVSNELVKYENTIARAGSMFETYVELALFSMLIFTLIVSKDFIHLFDSDRRNTVLFARAVALTESSVWWNLTSRAGGLNNSWSLFGRASRSRARAWEIS